MNGIKLFINKIKLSLQKHTGVTQNKKSYESWLSKGYTNTPTVTVIIQSHNKSLQVSHIVAKLRAYPSIELISPVNDRSQRIPASFQRPV